jgi:dienelactone hydrolase
VNRPEHYARPRSGSRGRSRPRGRQRHGGRQRGRSVPVILATVGICVLAGAAYLGAHFAMASSGAGSGASPPAGGSPHAVSTSGAADSPTPAASPAAGHPGEYRVAETRYTFTEHTRAVGTRILHVRVRFPVARASSATTAGMFPLVVFAPGYLQCDDSYSALLRQWTSAGYVVAAVEFPLTNCHVLKPDESDLSNQPADIAYVIRRLLSLSARRGDALTGLISPSRVGVAGHSDGGDTVAAMAAMSCCRYPGLRAVMVLSGAEWPYLRGRWFSAPTPPMLFVQGTADTVNLPSASIELYKADTTGSRYYLKLFGADHLSPYEGVGAPEPIVERVTIDFLDRYLAGQEITPGTMRRAARVPGISELVSGSRMP